MKERAITGGDLGLDSVFLYTKKSAEVIVTGKTSRHQIGGSLNEPEKD